LTVYTAVGLKLQVKSSFCEQKEAKKLCQFSFAPRRLGLCAPNQIDKSFLLLFFKKADRFLGSLLLLSLSVHIDSSGSQIFSEARFIAFSVGLALFASGTYGLWTGNYHALEGVWAIAGPIVGAVVAFYFGAQRKDTV